MMQGIQTTERVRLLMDERKHGCYHVHRRQKRVDTRKRKAVRGCITSTETAVLNVAVVKKGDKDIEGLTDEASHIPNRMGPKRASKIRKLWNLEKTDDVTQYVIKRVYPVGGESKRKKAGYKIPKVQRLLTPKGIARSKKRAQDIKDSRQRTKDLREAYEKMIAAKRAATRSRRESKLSKTRGDQKAAPKAAAAAAPKDAKAAPKTATKGAAAPKAATKAAAPAKKAQKK